MLHFKKISKKEEFEIKELCHQVTLLAEEKEDYHMVFETRSILHNPYKTLNDKRYLNRYLVKNRL